jgi:hypothetical protein
MDETPWWWDPYYYPMSGRRFNQFIKKAIPTPNRAWLPAHSLSGTVENGGKRRNIFLAFPLEEI